MACGLGAAAPIDKWQPGPFQHGAIDEKLSAQIATSVFSLRL
jgi:hypothetical protein